jgi:hypothetical protein
VFSAIYSIYYTYCKGHLASLGYPFAVHQSTSCSCMETLELGKLEVYIISLLRILCARLCRRKRMLLASICIHQKRWSAFYAEVPNPSQRNRAQKTRINFHRYCFFFTPRSVWFFKCTCISFVGFGDLSNIFGLDVVIIIARSASAFITSNYGRTNRTCSCHLVGGACPRFESNSDTLWSSPLCWVMTDVVRRRWSDLNILFNHIEMATPTNSLSSSDERDRSLFSLEVTGASRLRSEICSYTYRQSTTRCAQEALFCAEEPQDGASGMDSLPDILDPRCFPVSFDLKTVFSFVGRGSRSHRSEV